MKIMLKRIIVLIVIIAICGQTFAAVVSDNDGSAFITKAEFDSLKNNFQSQLDSYNTSIDTKIDNAIASYISGITVSKTKLMSPNINEIKYPIEIIHHKKNIEEADDEVTTDFPQETPLWSPSWKMMTINVRGNYRIYDRFQYPQIDNIGTFVAGYKLNNDWYKLTGSVSGFKKTCNYFYLLDGHPYNSTILTYIIVSDCNNSSFGLQANANAWMDRSSYIVGSYNDLFKYYSLETNLKLTNFSAENSKANNKTRVSSSDNWKKWKNSTSYLWHGPNHGCAYTENGNTVECGHPSYNTTFSKIYNNNNGNCLAPVSYFDSANNRYELYYTNKQKNRKFYQYDATGVQNATWAFNVRANTTTYSDRGVSGILTRGFNLESELENTTGTTSRNWYNKSLIKQSRIIYDFTTKNKTVENHKIGEGVPLLIFDKGTIGGDNYEKVKIKFNLATDYPLNKKYIVFSKQPIILDDYSADVDSDTHYEIIKESNGTTWETTKRKVELVTGENTIVLNDFSDNDALYYKILWNTTNVKGGTNYDDELITVDNPTLEITYS